MVIGEDAAADAAASSRTEGGITLVTPRMLAKLVKPARLTRVKAAALHVLHVAPRSFRWSRPAGSPTSLARAARRAGRRRASTCGCCCPASRRCARHCVARARSPRSGRLRRGAGSSCWQVASRHRHGRSYLIDCSVTLFGRPGNPYSDADGADWPDNHTPIRAARLGRPRTSAAGRRPRLAPQTWCTRTTGTAGLAPAPHLARCMPVRARRPACSRSTTWPIRAASTHPMFGRLGLPRVGMRPCTASSSTARCRS